MPRLLKQFGATKGKLKASDFTIVLLVMILVIFGVVMVFSASYYKSINEDGTPYHLREDAAQALYTQMVHAWIDDAKVEWQPGFEHLDIQKLMTKPETFWEKLDVFHWFH